VRDRGLTNKNTLEREREPVLHMSVGGMKDEGLKLRDLHTSYTLGSVGDWNP
jgi:hypothetical protein